MKKSKLSSNVTYEYDKQTVMHMTAYNDDIEDIQLLLRYEVNKSIKNESDQITLNCVTKIKVKNVIVLFKN